MTNIVDQSASWKPLLTSAIFTWLGGIASYLYNKWLALKFFSIFVVHTEI